MIIDFDELTPAVAERFKGGEGAALIYKFEDENNRIMRITLAAGSSIGYHVHEGSSEILYVLQGRGTAIDENGRSVLAHGVCHYCPEGKGHSIVNDGEEDLTFFAVVPTK